MFLIISEMTNLNADQTTQQQTDDQDENELLSTIETGDYNGELLFRRFFLPLST